jgi:hypothetical protein
MINEVTLFVDKIKPAVLLDQYEIEESNINIYNYYYVKCRGGILISHTPLPDYEIGTAELGKILGYYPKSCDAFENCKFNFPMEFLHFSGMIINTCGYYDEALNWCIEQYGEKILKQYGKLRYIKSFSRFTIGNFVDRESFRKIVI